MKKHIFSFLTLLLANIAMLGAMPANLYVVGSGCDAGWDTNKALEMTCASEGIFTWSGLLNASGEFKFLPERSWNTSYTCDFNTSGNQTVVSGQSYKLYLRGEHEGADNKFVVETSGNYDVTVNLNDMTMVCTLLEEVKSLRITGNACSCGWTTDKALSLTAEGNDRYSITTNLTAGGNFRFLTSNSWYPTYTTAVKDEPVSEGMYTLVYYENQPEGEPAFLVTMGGNYTLTVDLKAMTLTMVRNSEQLYIIGNALTGADGNWDYAKAQEMTYNSANELFEWSGELKARSEGGNPAEFKFLKSNTGWDGYVSASAANVTITSGDTYPIADSNSAPDRKFIVPEDGIYTITVSLTEMKMTITKGTNTSIESMPGIDAKIEVSGREIIFNLDGATDVAVYDIAGRLVGSTYANGSAAITVPAPGIYIASTANKAIKIAVR